MSEINCVSSENKWKTLPKSFVRTSTFQLHIQLVHSRTYISRYCSCHAHFQLPHTHLKAKSTLALTHYLSWRAQMPSGEIINVQSKIQVAHQDEARTKQRFAVRAGEERAMADFSFGISEKSQCTKSTWANRERGREREREREEDAGSVRGAETAQRSCQFHLRSLTRICLHRFLHLVACLLFTFCFFLLSLSLFFGALFLTNFLLNTTWKHFPLREAHIKYHCHVWVCVPRVCKQTHTL